jgi:subtilisin family serine protease
MIHRIAIFVFCCLAILTSNQSRSLLPHRASGASGEDRACLKGPTLWKSRNALDVDGNGRSEFIVVIKARSGYLAHWSTFNNHLNLRYWAKADSLIVRLKSPLTPLAAKSYFSSILNEEHLNVSPLPLQNTFLIKGNWTPKAANSLPLLLRANELRSKSGILRASPDFIYFSLTSMHTDPGFAHQDDLQRIGALLAWTSTKGSPDIKVAVLDTGIDGRHPDLDSNVKGGINIINPSALPDDDNGHGTYCAGIIGAKHDGHGIMGVNAFVTMIPIKFLDSDGCGQASDAIKGIQFAINKKVDIISNSWGGAPYSPDLEDKIRDAMGSDILFVAGAGNEPRDLDNLKQAFFPAAYPLANVISVGATYDSDAPRLDWGHGNHRVHLSAPGEGVYSTLPKNYGSYGSEDGTSAAAAFVSGACALLKSEMLKEGLKPTFTDIRSRLLQTTTDPSRKIAGSGASCSQGRLDLANAIVIKKLNGVSCP